MNIKSILWVEDVNAYVVKTGADKEYFFEQEDVDRALIDIEQEIQRRDVFEAMEDTIK